VGAWDVIKREDAHTAADPCSRACLREWINKGRSDLLILVADNGETIQAVTLESWLEELGVLWSFTIPRVSNAYPFSKSLCCASFNTVLTIPPMPSISVDETCALVTAFGSCPIDRRRHSGILFLTLYQRPCREVITICRHCAHVKEQTCQCHPPRWSCSICCWRKPAAS
jgi:hypothetical protein